MASLNTSKDGPYISASYQKVVNAPTPSGPAASSPTYAQWALFTVQAPLVSAFQSEVTGGKESVLKVQTTGEGELIDLVEDFNDGRIQFAFVKVKDPNTGLPKNVLVAWCGEGVPERTKGYFTSHLQAVAKLLHGYHVQITARSDADLSPNAIVQKVADASGSKYGGDTAPSTASKPSAPIASKPIMPTKSVGVAGGFQPLGARSRQPPTASNVDEDGWGTDAPPVTRSQLEKVQSAYQPTKVDMTSLQSQREPSRYEPTASSNGTSDVVRGGYQPIGKVDIESIRKQAQQEGRSQDDRPTVVKGAYQPVGKVDIAEIRRKAQGGAAPAPVPLPSQPSGGDDERPKSLADRSAAFQGGSERLTSLPKPQIANRFGSQTGNFAGTKAPTPSGFGPKPSTVPTAATANKTYADEGGKTPAQIWAEKKAARERGSSIGTDSQAAPTSPIGSQPSGGWQSGYAGKKWGVNVPTRTGGSGVSEQRTGEEPIQDEGLPASGGIGAIRDRFAGAAPMGAARESAPEPPPLDVSSKPSTGGARGIPIPGLPQRPQTGVPAEEHQDLPPPPPRPIPQDEPEEEQVPEQDYEPQGSPPRIAMPVARSAEPEPLEKPEPLPPRPIPTDSLHEAISQQREPSPEPETSSQEPARSAGVTTAASTFGPGAAAAAAAAATPSAASVGGKEAIAQYDYEKAEDNELELHEGERVTNIDMVDEDWWMGTNSRGEVGLFPANYVELVEGGSGAAQAAPAATLAAAEDPELEPEPAVAAAAGGGKTATAQYDYEAAEDNELSFPDGATITNLEFPDEDWWLGEYGGQRGLFPANYVQLDE